ncbi:MAG: trypsin-like peptidase domain-containing protein [Clostridia bacterium]|nr:trypsin-like peptidase domain-containing protein [Clostridia bacterium]
MSDFNYENNNENEINEAERKREERRVRLRNRTPLFVILTVILLLVALFIGYDMGRSVGRGPSTRPSNPATSTTTPSGAFAPTVIAPTTTIEIPKSDSPVAEPVEGSYVYVNDKVASSVVSITTEATVYSIFYGSYVESGAGSGVIIANTGNTYYIITNNHVVEGYNAIKVYTAAGGEYEATVIGTDWTTDIAIIRIETEDKLSVVEIGDSSNLKAGQNIAAIGNPLGLFGGTITPGIISAVTREIPIEGVGMTLIQHSASVSPGNSGGGLFNMKGQLIGVVNAKTLGESVESIGFAIPINTAYRVANEIINQGYASGIPSLDVSISARGSYVYIEDYKHNDALSASGQRTISRGDILVGIDDTKISGQDSIRSVLSTKEIGDKVKLTVYGVKTSTAGYSSYETYTVEVEIYEYNPTK